MSAAILEKKMSQLPPEKQKEVQDFIDFLLSQDDSKNPGKKIDVKKPMFGSAKGMFKMSADFDEPLEDFKDYM